MDLEYKTQDINGIFKINDLEIIGCSGNIDSDLDNLIEKMEIIENCECGIIEESCDHKQLRIFFLGDNFSDINLYRNKNGYSSLTVLGFNRKIIRQNLNEIVNACTIQLSDDFDSDKIDLVSREIITKEIYSYMNAKTLAELSGQDFQKVYCAIKYVDFLFNSKKVRLNESVIRSIEKYGVEIL